MAPGRLANREVMVFLGVQFDQASMTTLSWRNDFPSGSCGNSVGALVLAAVDRMLH
jgi:hypothetical protein